MIKEELIRKVSKRTGFQQTEIFKILDCTIDEIMNQVSQGNRVELRGFGIFERREHKGCWKYNPATGRNIYVDARYSPAFKVGTRFKEIVNE